MVTYSTITRTRVYCARISIRTCIAPRLPYQTVMLYEYVPVGDSRAPVPVRVLDTVLVEIGILRTVPVPILSTQVSTCTVLVQYIDRPRPA